MNRLLAWFLTLGNNGAVANARAVLDERRRCDRAVDAMVQRIA